MAWVRLDDSFAQHPKSWPPVSCACHAGCRAMLLQPQPHGRFILGCARTLLSWEMLGPNQERYRISVTDDTHTEEIDSDYVIKRLVETGLWEEVPGGYQIHDYLQYQPSKAKVMAERAAAQERMARRRKEMRSEDVRANIGGTSDELREKFNFPDPDPDPINKDHMSSPAPPSRTSASDEEYSRPLKHGGQTPRKVRKRKPIPAGKPD